MSISPTDRFRLVLSRWKIFTGLVIIILLVPGMKARVFRAREAVPEVRAATLSVSVPAAHEPLPPARLEQLPAGARLEGQNPPAGWSHLVFKSIPKLTTGDLDTVSAQAFEIASRIRPLMVAEVRRISDDPGAPFQLKRVGAGLCAPGSGEGTDVVVSTMSIAGTKGEWTTKQRLVLAALSYESSKAKLSAATSTFAIVRSPVVFLVEGQHRKLELCYALRVEPQSGRLETIVWPDLKSASDAGSPAPVIARRLTAPVFDLPQDVHATRALGKIAIAWSFAIRGLPDGPGLSLPSEFLRLEASATESDARSAVIEQTLIRLDPMQGEATDSDGRPAH